MLEFSNVGGDFVFGALNKTNIMHNAIFGTDGGYLFALTLIPTIIVVAVIVNIAYHLGIMQRLVSVIAKVVYKLMKVSGSEALSNVSSAFVGQVEAQLMIKPYVPTMTMSELLASMTGSLAWRNETFFNPETKEYFEQSTMRWDDDMNPHYNTAELYFEMDERGDQWDGGMVECFV